MEPPPGYPPPTLVRKKSRRVPVKAVLLFLALFATIGFLCVNFLLSDGPPAPSAPVRQAETDASGAGDADAAPAILPDTAAGPPQVIVEQPIEEGVRTANAPDGRKPNKWYYVSRLGDGPGVIYSRDGGRWNFAFACDLSARTIEFIAVGTGSPGAFVGQTIMVGSVRQALEAAYSKDGGGTITSTLPASDPFFNALDGSMPMEVQLVADRKTIVPIGPDVVRLISECRGRG